MAYRTDPRVAQGPASPYRRWTRVCAATCCRVYNYMGLGLAITGLVAFVVGIDAGPLRADLRHAR